MDKLFKHGSTFLSSQQQQQQQQQQGGGGIGDASKPDLLHMTATSLLSSSSTSSTQLPQKAGQAADKDGNTRKAPLSHNEILSSTKVVFQAVQGKARGGEKVDTGKVAGAAGNLLAAAAHYGKMEDGMYGMAIHKAEDCLHGYETSHVTGGTPSRAEMPDEDSSQPNKAQ